MATIDQALKGSASYHLDFLRGAAAILVLINHYRNFFFVGYGDLANPSIFTSLLYSVAGLGHQAVMIFFVLSGFLITRSILSRVATNSWSWKNYLISRLSRLYVVLVPVLLFVLVIDLIGSSLFDYSYFVGDIKERLNPVTFLGNLAFLQEIFVEKFGTNAPLWSLAYEFWYYMLFPCLLLIFVNKKNVFKTTFYIVISALIFLMIGKEITIYFLVWLMGSLLCVIPKWNVNSTTLKVALNSASLFALIGALGISRLGIIQSQAVGDFLIAIAFAALAYSILHFNINFNLFPKIKKRYYSFSRRISGFSYTLYLLHYPMFVFIFAYIRSIGGDAVQPTIINILYGILVCFLVVLFAWFVSLYTEDKTSNVRDFAFRIFKPRKVEKIKIYKDAK